MSQDETTGYGDDNLVSQDESFNEKFPDSKIVRLVQMDGYLQYHFEDGTSGSAKLDDDVGYLTSKWDEQQQDN